MQALQNLASKVQVPLKVVAFIYFLFSIFTQMVDWLPRSYAFMEAWCLALFLWALHSREDLQPISMLIVSLIMGIIFDILHLWLSFDSSYKYLVGSGIVGSEMFYFAVTMSVVALVLKPFYMIALTGEYGKRGGDVSVLFSISGSVGGMSGGGFMSQGGQAYQNLDGGDDRASMLGSGVKDPNSAFAGQMGGGQNMMGGGGGYGY